MTITITKKTELKNPYLDLTIFLETGQIRVQLKHTCASCGGYGCPGGKCDDTIHLTASSISETLGTDGIAALKRAFAQILGDEVLPTNDQ